MRIVFVGNHSVDYSSETHHVKSLQSLGHDVVTLQEGKTRGEDILAHGRDADMVVFIHTHGWRTPGLSAADAITALKNAGIPTVTYHLDLWLGLHRERDLTTDPFYTSIGWFFTVDKKMADWFNTNTSVKGRFLPAAVYGPECYISTEPSPYANDVVFVGSRRYHPEHPWRHQLIDFLRLAYRSQFTHVGGDGDTGTLRGDDLNRMYANSKIAVGDTLCIGYNYPYYASDRLFECPGRGGFNLFPRITGITDWYRENEEIVFYEYGDFDGLKNTIDLYLAHADERERIRLAGHNRTKQEHIYSRRWEHILETVLA